MKIDINGDGKLTKRELLSGKEFTKEEVNIFFSGTLPFLQPAEIQWMYICHVILCMTVLLAEVYTL